MNRIGAFLKDVKQSRVLLLMALPATLWFLFFSYLPMAGMVIAFKQYRYSRDGFWASIVESKWVGLQNFKFLFSTNDAYIITRNTLLYNIVFIIAGLVLSVGLAIVLSEIVNKKMAKLYQTGMFLPYFYPGLLSAISCLAFSALIKGCSIIFSRCSELIQSGGITIKRTGLLLLSSYIYGSR